MAEKLEIVVDTARAIQSLNDMGNASDRLLATLAKLNGAPGVSKLVQQIQSVNNVNLSGVTNSLSALQSAINNVNPSNLGGVTQAAQSAQNSAAQFGSMATAVRNAVAEMGGMTASAAAMAGGLLRGTDASVSLTGSLSNLLGVTPRVAAGMLALGGIVVFKQLAEQALRFAESLNEPTQQIIRLQATLDSAGQKGDGLKALEQLRDVAKSTGGSMQALIDPFNKFAVVAKQSGMTVQQTTDIFKGFQTALTGSGASVEATKRTFTALQQMMSKGTVQMEELKQQLGDSLPGALDGASRSMGVTTKELMKMVEQGKVLAVDLLPRFAAEMEKTWSSAAQAQIKSFVGQMNLLRNEVWELTLAFGGGPGSNSLLGASSGFAAVIASINSAVSLPGLRDFASLLGDVLGVILKVTAAITGDFLRGLLLIPATVGQIYGAFASLINSMKEAVSQSTVLTAIFNGVSTAVSLLAGALPTLIGLFVGYKAAALAVSAVMSAWGLAVGAAKASAATLGAAVTGLGTAFTGTAPAVARLNAVMSGTSLSASTATASLTGLAARTAATGTAAGAATAGVTAFGAAIGRMLGPIGLIVSALGLVYLAMEKLGAVSAIKNAFSGVKEAVDPAAASLELFAKSASNVADRIKTSSFRGLYESATAFETYTGKAEAAKLANEQYALQEIKSTAAMKSAKAALDEKAAREQSYQATIKASNISLKERIDAEKSAADATKRSAEAITSNMTGMRVDSEARIAAKAAADQHKMSLDGLNQSLKANESAMASSQNFIGAMRAAHEANAAAAEQSKIKHEEAEKIFRHFGTTLTQTQLGIAELAMGMGKGAQDAAKLAINIEMLTRSNEDWIKSLETETQALNTKIANGNALIALLQKELSVIKEKEGDLRALSDLEKIRKGLLESQIKTLQDTVGQLTETRLAQELLAEAMRNGGDMTKAAITVFDRYQEQLKGVKSVEELVAIGRKSQDEQTKQVTESLKKNTNEAAKSASTLEGLGRAASSVGEFMSNLAKNLFTVSDPAAKVKADVPVITSALNSLQPSVASLNEKLPAVGAAFEQIGTAAASAPANINALSAAMVPLGQSVAEAGPTITKIADDFRVLSENAASVFTSMTGLTAVVPPLVEPLKALADAVGSLASTSANLSSAADNIKVFTENLQPAFEQLTLVGTAIAKADEATKALDQTVKANSSLFAPLEASITSLIGKIDEAISKFNAMAEAARKAAAAGAGGGGGGGNELTVGGQSLGGMAGSALHAISASASTFANAPALAKGIANTNSLTKRTKGSGIPTILHPNEAVVPLPRGRSIPVDMNVGGGLDQINSAMSAMSNVISFMEEAARRSDNSAREASMAVKPSMREETTLKEAPAVRQSLYDRRKPESERRSSDGSGEAINISFTVHANDANSFNKSQAQIQADLYKSINRARRSTR